jgi:hypothetical protein
MAKEKKDAGFETAEPAASLPQEPQALPPVNPNYVRDRIAAQDARKEAERPGSSKPLVP